MIPGSATPGTAEAPSRPRLLSRRALAMGLGLLIVAVFAGANAHLIYVAFDSQPGCVAHHKATGEPGEAASFGAAQSSC